MSNLISDATGKPLNLVVHSNSSAKNLAYANNFIGRQGIERLDLLILLIETLEINGVSTMLSLAEKYDLIKLLPNRVELWKLRSHNRLRKASRLGQITNEEVEALIILISFMSNRLYPIIRQLLSSKEPAKINNDRWAIVIERIKNLMNERMNLRRSYVKKLMYKDNTYIFFRKLLFTLSLSSGPGGIDRLRASIYDGFK